LFFSDISYSALKKLKQSAIDKKEMDRIVNGIRRVVTELGNTLIAQSADFDNTKIFHMIEEMNGLREEERK